MRLSEEFLRELNDRSDIESIASAYVNLRRAGGSLKGLCPFHGEKTPSFTLYPQSNSFYCFGCGAGGDVITFIRQIEHLDYMEAVKFLADRAGMQLPQDTRDDAVLKLRQRILELNRKAARFFYSQLVSPSGKAALSYLRERGLRDETIKHFGLGYSPNLWEALLRHLSAEGFNEQEIEAANLAGKNRSGKYYDRFRNRIMFPIIDLRGSVIAFGGRCMPGEDGAKYINSSDTPVFKKSRNLYALNFAKGASSEEFLLAEGYMDVIALHQQGFTGAVAALGTAFTPEQAKLMARYKKSVTLILDSDEAGRRATNRAMDILSKTGMRVRVLTLPDAKDPDEFIKKYGKERFEKLLTGAGNDIEYTLSELRKKHDTTTDGGRLLYLGDAAQALSAVPDPIARELYAGRLSEEFGVAKNVLMQRIGKAFGSRVAAQKKKSFADMTYAAKKDAVNPESAEYMRASGAEAELLSIIMNHPDYFPPVFAKIKPGQFVTKFHARVYEALAELYEDGHGYDPAFLSGRFDSNEMGRIIFIQNRAPLHKQPQNAWKDCIRVILEERDKKEQKAASEMNIDEWEESFRKLREKQKGV